MDTDDLTPMAYTTLSLGYQACEPLRAEIGVAAGQFKMEDEFLHGVSEFMKDILRDPADYLDSWNLLGEVDAALFAQRVRLVEEHIAITLKTPYGERGMPPFQQQKR